MNHKKDRITATTDVDISLLSIELQSETENQIGIMKYDFRNSFIHQFHLIFKIGSQHVNSYSEAHNLDVLCFFVLYRLKNVQKVLREINV